MFIIIGVLAGTFAAAKGVVFLSDFIYDMTKGRKNEKNWAEFMVLYNRLKAEHIARLEEECLK